MKAPYLKKLFRDVEEVYDQHSTHCPLNREVFLVQSAETEKLAKFCSSETQLDALQTIRT
jgi:hypothetical protein